MNHTPAANDILLGSGSDGEETPFAAPPQRLVGEGLSVAFGDGDHSAAFRRRRLAARSLAR